MKTCVWFARGDLEIQSFCIQVTKGKIRVRDRKNPQMTHDISLRIYQRQNIHDKALYCNNPDTLGEYRNLCNDITSQINHSSKTDILCGMSGKRS